MFKLLSSTKERLERGLRVTGFKQKAACGPTRGGGALLGLLLGVQVVETVGSTGFRLTIVSQFFWSWWQEALVQGGLRLDAVIREFGHPPVFAHRIQMLQVRGTDFSLDILHVTGLDLKDHVASPVRVFTEIGICIGDAAWLPASLRRNMADEFD